MKLLSLLILLFSLSACFVTKKKYISMEQEIVQLKSNLQDDDKDGVPNYRDLEPNSDNLVNVDSKGRTIVIEKIVDIDQDGILDSEDFCPTIKGIATANGCPDWDNDGIYDFLDRCPKAVGVDTLNGCPFIKEEGVIYVKKTPLSYGIRFIDKTTKYKPKTKLILDTLTLQVSEVLLKNPEYKIEIQSHTDSIGDSLKNIDLCQKRAEQIKKLLVKKGIEEQRVLIKAFGSSQSKHSNDTKEGREANNRIEFLILNKEEK
jgi:outer membrane protein OmpA-like peptidoglycan-associated protein